MLSLNALRQFAPVLAVAAALLASGTVLNAQPAPAAPPASGAPAQPPSP